MTILDTILEAKRDEVAALKARRSASSFMDEEHFHRPALSLRASLNEHSIFGIIAEFKRRSPSAGSIQRVPASPASVARAYHNSGAAGISVLTDGPFFSGSLADLREVRNAVTIPVLRKEFILDELQVYEARSAGADAVLLIAGVLDKHQLSDLHDAATGVGLECLVELHNLADLDILDGEKMRLFGVNNRDLRTFSVDIFRTIEIARLLPADATIVSESGIHDAATLRQLHAAGVHAALIGELFMKSADPGAALAGLLKDFSG